MHQNVFGGRAPLGPGVELRALLRASIWIMTNDTKKTEEDGEKVKKYDSGGKREEFKPFYCENVCTGSKILVYS